MRSLFIFLLFCVILCIVGGCKSVPRVGSAESIITQTTQANIPTSQAQIKIVQENNLYKYLNYLIVGSIVATVLCAVLFAITGKIAGIVGAVGCLLCFIFALVVSQYLKLIAIIGGIGLLVLFVYFIYILISNKKALSELVESIQIAKNKAINREEFKELMTILQSNSTKEIVSEEKAKLSI